MPVDAQKAASALTTLAEAARAKGVSSVCVEVEDVGYITLTLGPLPITKTPAPAEPAQPKGVAARLMAQHETQFAASRFRPPAPQPVTPDSVVPRAVRAKQEAARGAKKSQKRGS